MNRRKFLKAVSASTFAAGTTQALARENAATGECVSVAAVQISGYDKVGECPESADPVSIMLPCIQAAGRNKTDLLVFPEYHLGKIAVPGTETQRIADAVRQQNLHLIVGAWELLDEGKFANAALLFGRNGDIVGKYYKTHAAVDSFDKDRIPWTAPPKGHARSWFNKNDPEWIMEKGRDLPVFQLDFGTVGILTCYDGWFPEPWRVLSLKGAEIIVWINGRHGSIEDYIVRSAMFQNEVHVIAANQAYGAGTMIGRYPNIILKRLTKHGQASIEADLDMKTLRSARAHSRNLAQRRPDLYGTLTEPRPNREQYLGTE